MHTYIRYAWIDYQTRPLRVDSLEIRRVGYVNMFALRL